MARNSRTGHFTHLRFCCILTPNLVGARMKVTRVIAVAVMATSVGLTTLNAQSLRKASPPAEFPPSSYSGKQYVDSRGCIYIRAGIDGNTTWVPRVSRDRKQVCGYKPTAVAGSTSAPAKSASVEQITLPASQQPKSSAKAKTVAPTTKTATKAPTPAPAAPKATPKPVPAPAAVAAAKPRTVTTTKTTTARPTTTTAPTVTTAPRTTTKVVPVAPAPSAPASGCSNASTFSQQFINKQGVRCGPQTEAPVTYGSGWDKSSSLVIDPKTRIVPRHVYENRQNTRDVVVPSGYRTVWQDDRLNPYRAERTANAASIQTGIMVPRGYRRVEREDDRLNPNRAYRNAQGDAQSDLIWTQTVPRTLVPFESTRPVITLTEATAKSAAEAKEPGFWRISTRSAPSAGTPVVTPSMSVDTADHK